MSVPQKWRNGHESIQKWHLGMVFYAAVLLALIGLLCYGLVAPASAQEDSRTLPILMYHDIVPEGGLLDDYTASVAQLEADLQALAQEGWQTVRLSEVITYVRMGAPLPEKPVLLVFDDGYRSILTQVLPLLQKYNACAVVSVIGARAQGLRTARHGRPVYDLARSCPRPSLPVALSSRATRHSCMCIAPERACSCCPRKPPKPMKPAAFRHGANGSRSRAAGIPCCALSPTLG